MPTDQLLLFHGSEPDVYLIGSIYDPEVHTAITGKGKVVPAIGSTVFDNEQIPGQFIQYVVSEVDGVTLKSTLAIPHVPIGFESIPDRLVSYGNDTMMLFYDDRSTPTRLIVDTKFVMIGSASAEYVLKKVVNDVEVVISAKIDTDGNFETDRIPLIETSVPGVRKLSDCHTTYDIEDAEFVMLEVYDSTGVLTTTVRLTTKRASILNDYLATTNPVIGFTASSNQTNQSDWVLYRDQNPMDLNIYPVLTFANGETELVTINNVNCFIYGMEEINTGTPDVQYEILIKYFLADDVPSTIAEGNGVRFVKTSHILKIVNRDLFSFSKLSLIPRWDTVAGEWKLVYFGYYEDRDEVNIIPAADIRYVGTEFDGANQAEPQNLVIHTNTIDEFGNVGTYEQAFTIQLNDPTSTIPFTIAENENTEFIYGEGGSTHERPVVNFDAARGTYFIPTSSFNDLDEMLDNFYDRARPPFIRLTETEAPTPTHFVVRDSVSKRNLVAEPIDIATYDQEFVFLTLSGNANEYLDDTVVVEFLLDIAGEYSILYGVPVEVKAGVFNN